jgi:hypothetical protein
MYCPGTGLGINDVQVPAYFSLDAASPAIPSLEHQYDRVVRLINIHLSPDVVGR